MGSPEAWPGDAEAGDGGSERCSGGLCSATSAAADLVELRAMWLANTKALPFWKNARRSQSEWPAM
jgi:hypothetical protein